MTTPNDTTTDATAEGTSPTGATTHSPSVVSFKRKKRLINRRLQLKLVGVFTAIGVTCSLFQLALVNFGMMDIATSAAQTPESMMRAARQMMLENVGWTIAAMLPLMICVGLIVTHRIAGPAYRMTEHLLAIADGGPVRGCHIRTQDEFQELCAAMNAALEHLTASAPQEAATSKPWDLDSTPSLVQAGVVPETTKEANDSKASAESAA